MNNKVVCDKCSKKFEIKVKTRKLPLGVEEVYFTCPHCKEKYVSYYTDPEIREKQKKINKIHEDYRRAKTGEDIIKMLRTINAMKAEIKSDMEALKKKMLGTQ